MKFPHVDTSTLRRLVLAVALPLMVLLWHPIFSGFERLMGEDLLLATEPVDPRDFFRGDYVILSYEISTLSLSLLPGERPETLPETLYVILERDSDGMARANALALSRPQGGLYLEGRVARQQLGMKDSVTLAYGIERFYVKEGTGHAFEKLIRERALYAHIRVYKGKAHLVELVHATSERTSSRIAPSGREVNRALTST